MKAEERRGEEEAVREGRRLPFPYPAKFPRQLECAGTAHAKPPFTQDAPNLCRPLAKFVHPARSNLAKPKVHEFSSTSVEGDPILGFGLRATSEHRARVGTLMYEL